MQEPEILQKWDNGKQPLRRKVEAVSTHAYTQTQSKKLKRQLLVEKFGRSMSGVC